jgi:hypothetical protein
MAGPRDPKALEQLERFRRRTALPAQRADEAGWPQNNASSALEQLRRAAEVARLTEQQNQEMQARGQELANRVTEELELATARIRAAEARELYDREAPHPTDIARPAAERGRPGGLRSAIAALRRIVAVP